MVRIVSYGYVRGMSEVLAALLAVTPEEVEAFWGFCSIMEMVLWTGLPCPNFHLLLSCALLEGTRDTGDDGDSGDDGDTDEDGERDEAPPAGGPLDAEEALSRAEGLFLQLAAAPDLPPTLQELLGLGGPPPSPPPEPLHPETAGGTPRSSP
ncbi:LOW QUALITY PROTEIN: TBC1 domain family member 17-like [Sarcoramphus papa]